MKKTTKLLLTILPVFFVLFAATFTLLTNTTYAATLTVNSTADDEDNDGECTLREAITAANDDTASGAAAGECLAGSGADTINFNIAGGGVQTIVPGSLYPIITEQLTIDGYSQSGAEANTAPSPQPMNGTILIELDGVDKTDNYLGFTVQADDTVIKGLNMHECRSFDANSRTACINVEASDVLVQGNYLGMMPDGLTSISSSATKATNLAVHSTAGTGLVVGGLDAADRNIISNAEFGTSSVTIQAADSTVIGNYIGIGKDGVTDLDGVGGVSIQPPGTNAIIGGATSAHRNVVSGANQSNIIFFGASDNTVQGNYLCTDYTGNPNAGITTYAGVNIASGSANNLVGGTAESEKNTIKGCDTASVTVLHFVIPDASIDAYPTKNALLGNEMSSTRLKSYPGSSTNSDSAILFGRAEDTDSNFLPDLVTILNINNDSGDGDSGPNHIMNYPIINDVAVDGDNLNINYNLDTADSPSNNYRIEFFASNSDQVDKFGLGMGQVYLGSFNASPGSGLSSSLAIDSGINLNNKLISATATAIDNTTSSGFGSTSRISPPFELIDTNNTSSNDSTALADTGQNTAVLYSLAVILLVSSLLVALKRSATSSRYR